MEVYANLDTLFKRDKWAKRTWHAIRSWLQFNFNKYHRKLVREARHGRPWDIGYLYELEYAKIEEMIHYHERVKRFVGVERVISHMKLCLSLIEIFTEKRELHHFTGGLQFKDADNVEKGLKQIVESPDFKYHCDVNVNLKNIDRFVPFKEMQDYYLDHPHEVYILKAKALYHKIRSEQDFEWWD